MKFVFTNSGKNDTRSALMKDLEKNNAPDVIKVVPGPCFYWYPDIDVSAIANVIVGRK